MGFSHVTTWVFDLDETLYPVTTPLFPQIEARMVRWIVATLGVSEAEADTLRARWWHDHGTTLAGLMEEHGQDPDPFLDDVHEIDFSVLTPDAELRAAIAALPGRKIIHTNGTVRYAERVLAARGLTDLWDAMHGIEHSPHHRPKPHAENYDAIHGRDGLDPARAAMFEDSARNLAVPHARGFACVHVAPERGRGAHVQYHTNDLTAFLRDIVTTGA